MSGRDIDDEAINVASSDGLEMFGYCIDVPTIDECLTRLDLMPRELDEFFKPTFFHQGAFNIDQSI